VPAATRKPKRRRAYKGVACPRCDAPLAHSRITTGPQVCRRCGLRYRAARFDPSTPEVVVTSVAESAPGESVSCANHEKNAAVAECGRCGSFICELCRIDTDGKTFCPACFDRLKAEGALESTVTRFKDYLRMSLTASLIGFLFGALFLGVILGPAAIVYAIKGIRHKRRTGETEGMAWLGVAIFLGIAVTGFGAFISLAMVGGGL
jgi:ribosomal protein L37AE/L43A